MKEHKGNLFDLAVLLVIGFCLFSGVGRFLETRAHSNVRDRTAIVTLRIRSTEAYLPSAVFEGEGVFLASKEYFGELVSARASEALVVAEGEGMRVTGAWEDGRLWDVWIEIRVSGRVGESRFLRSGSDALLLGRYLSLYTERAYLYGEILDVRILAGE